MNTNFQVLLNDNITRLSALRYGDAKTLPAIDVLLPQGFDSLVNALKQGVDVRYNTRERRAAHAVHSEDQDPLAFGVALSWAIYQILAVHCKTTCSASA